MRRPSLWLAACFSLLSLGGFVPAPAWAQGGRELPKEGGATQLENDFKKVKSDFDDFVGGDKKARDKNDADLKVIDTAAKYFAYRLTWSDYQTGVTQMKSLAKVHEDFHNAMAKAAKAKGNQKFLALFGHQMVKRLEEVIDQGNLKAGINAGVMLQRLGQGGQPELIDDLVELLKSKRPAYVKLYTLKALKEVLERQTLPKEPAALKAYLDRVGKAVPELVAYLDSPQEKLGYPKKIPAAEQAQADAVIRYFRREAIRALAQVRVPEVGINTGEKKIQGAVAYQLLRVLANQDLTPKASLSEQTEAAVGLCLLRPEAKSPYQIDLSLYLVGQFIKDTLGPGYNQDYDAIHDVVKEPRQRREKGKAPPRGADRLPPAEPWRLYAARLTVALQQLQASIPDAKTKARVQDLLTHATKIFEPMASGRKVEDQYLGNLGRAMDRIKPTDGTVYKGFDLQVNLNG